MYDNGTGVSQDYLEAEKWYRKAAEQGDPYSQKNLAVMYDFGKGVEKNPDEAIKWYEKSAAKGNKYSKGRLKELKGNK